MSDFAGMEELLQDFLLEAGELLSQVDNKLVELEKRPDDKHLLNDIFRGFHTIKGGAGFLSVDHLVTLCHKTENLFDKLRNAELRLSPELMDSILAATGTVRDMFGQLAQSVQPGAADPQLLDRLERALSGQTLSAAAPVPSVSEVAAVPVAAAVSATPESPTIDDINWDALHAALTGVAPVAAAPAVVASAPAPVETVAVSASSHLQTSAQEPPRSGAVVPPESTSRSSAPQQQTMQKETTIRIDTARLDQVLNLSGEIGLTKNRIANLKSQILHGKTDPDTLKTLDLAVNQLDLLVSDLQNAVMKTRMQPIGRLFQKYPRLARDSGPATRQGCRAGSVRRGNRAGQDHD
jgi:two-component system, chemotaxis family, sensor kinase CheA